MRADPEPQQAIIDFDRERPVAQADPDAAIAANALKMQGRVSRIAFQQREVLVGEGADIVRKAAIG